jgi:hypothetical protein
MFLVGFLQSTVLLRFWAINPVTVRQLFQHLSANGEEQALDQKAEMQRIIVGKQSRQLTNAQCA